MSEFRFLKLTQAAHPIFPILPWLAKPTTRRIPFSQRDLLNCPNFDIYANMPFFRVVTVDPHNPQILIIRYFKHDRLAFITGKITLPCDAEFEHILDAQILLREIEKVVLNNLYDSYDEDRDTRKRDFREKQDLFAFFLRSEDAAVDLDLSFTVHPDRKFIDPTQLQFRTQMTLDSLCAHIGCFLIYGDWETSSVSTPSTLSDQISPMSDYDADLDSDGNSLPSIQPSPDVSLSSLSPAMSDDNVVMADFHNDAADHFLVYGSAFFYRTVLRLLEIQLDLLLSKSK